MNQSLVRPRADECMGMVTSTLACLREWRLTLRLRAGYFTRYENLAFERTEDGVLTMRFHTDGGPVTFTGQTHEDLPKALEDIALDIDNQALIMTGTGDAFMDSIDGDSLGEIFKPVVWEKIRREGLAVLQRLLSLPIPVIGVANGPATVHSEYLLLTDVHIASDRATYGDFPHPAFGITAGDGLQVVWEEIAGTARAKWLLWTGETIDAATPNDGASSTKWWTTTGRMPAAWNWLAPWQPSRRRTGRCKSKP
ncbi:enoyl-CoA hydratase/isomerase family protein [Mycobacterium malmoense]|uniref:enoyl-CoA hydratase/isomerase family protein n=1 Tax=Mycobacterium malmoense TaxID=1780 RepID=UPI001ABF1ED1|nr:enoyl-CoA hydratase/isomerase family protein [Mycobacterium malmoense]